MLLVLDCSIDVVDGTEAPRHRNLLMQRLFWVYVYQLLYELASLSLDLRDGATPVMIQQLCVQTKLPNLCWLTGIIGALCWNGVCFFHKIHLGVAQWAGDDCCRGLGTPEVPEAGAKQFWIELGMICASPKSPNGWWDLGWLIIVDFLCS